VRFIDTVCQPTRRRGNGGAKGRHDSQQLVGNVP
jgi:hypothetical protein